MSRRRGESPTGEEEAGSGDEGRNVRNFDEDNAIPTHYEEPAPPAQQEIYQPPQPEYHEPPQPEYHEPPQPEYHEPPQPEYHEPPQEYYEPPPQEVYGGGGGNQGDQGNHFAYGNDNERGNSGRGNQGDQGNHFAYGNDNERGNSGRGNQGDQGNHFAYGNDNSDSRQPVKPMHPGKGPNNGGGRPVVINVSVNQPVHPQNPQQININQTNIVHPAAPQTRPMQGPVINYGPPVNANSLKPLPGVANLPPDTMKSNVPNVAPPPLRGISSHYSGLSWNKRPVPAPPININSLLADAPQAKVEINMMKLDEGAVKEALIAHVSGECCYNPRCAQECVITRVTSMSALHYNLDTFTERRFVSYEFNAYNNGPLDGPDRGPIPDPWGLQVNAGQPFNNSSRKMAIPHTDQIMGCFRCGSRGSLRCQSCNGSGGRVCGFCHGQRVRTDPQGNRGPCTFCNGSGTEKCIQCSGRGSVTCSNCHGSGKLKVFIELEISFKNNHGDFIIEESALPDHLISTVSGETLVSQTFAQVQPIMNFPDRRIVDNSRRLVESHRNLYSIEKPLMQKQELKAVTVTECEYQWNEFSSRFWVYGNERLVYLEDYPQKCCGCCCCCCCCKCCTIL